MSGEHDAARNHWARTHASWPRRTRTSSSTSRTARSSTRPSSRSSSSPWKRCAQAAKTARARHPPEQAQIAPRRGDGRPRADNRDPRLERGSLRKLRAIRAAREARVNRQAGRAGSSHPRRSQLTNQNRRESYPMDSASSARKAASSTLRRSSTPLAKQGREPRASRRRAQAAAPRGSVGSGRRRGSGLPHTWISIVACSEPVAISCPEWLRELAQSTLPRRVSANRARPMGPSSSRLTPTAWGRCECSAPLDNRPRCCTGAAEDAPVGALAIAGRERLRLAEPEGTLAVCSPLGAEEELLHRGVARRPPVASQSLVGSHLPDAAGGVSTSAAVGVMVGSFLRGLRQACRLGRGLRFRLRPRRGRRRRPTLP